MRHAPDRRLEDELRGEATRLGFTLFGIARPDPSEHLAFYSSWLEAGFHGEMRYLANRAAVDRRADPASSFPGARSVIVVGHEYGAASERPGGAEGVDDPSRAIVARYARGADYHGVIPHRLQQLLDWLGLRVEGGARGRILVDTAPVLERELATRAGLGWFGRNTMLIHPRHGSYVLLGFLMVDVALEATDPFERDHCGRCTACVDACPTGALLDRDENGAPVIDASRCISYLTIELKGPIPVELRPSVGNRVFGCDICQEVCPWTVKFGSSGRDDPAYRPRSWPADTADDASLPELGAPALTELTARILEMSGKEYQRVFADSPLARPRRKGMLRNLCVGLGNYGATSPRAAGRVRPVLQRAAAEPDPLIREHALWALARLEGGSDVEAPQPPPPG